VDRLTLTAPGARVTGSGTRSADGSHWQVIDAKAVVGTTKPGHAALTVRDGRFTVTSDDAGDLFDALGATADAQGGRLTATGTVDLGGLELSYDAHVDVRDFTLKRSPLLARVATLTSLSGITSALGGKGISFDRLTADLSERQGVVTIRDMVAAGPSLGLSVRGTVDRRRNVLALDGSVVPALYGLNQMAGRVPVLGHLLTGARKEGVQVIDFTVTGSATDPKVSARVSSLAPGLLRDLLRLMPR
jgi:hypothetical protein